MVKNIIKLIITGIKNIPPKNPKKTKTKNRKKIRKTKLFFNLLLILVNAYNFSEEHRATVEKIQQVVKLHTYFITAMIFK